MKYREILSDLRNRIYGGEFVPGAQLPLRRELLAQYGASTDTLQKVINTLNQEGFLESFGASGTRVSATPPHLYDIGIIVPVKHEENEIWDSLFENFIDICSELGRKHVIPYRFRFYYGIEKHKPDSNDFMQLLNDIESHRLAGLIVLQHLRLSMPMINQLGSVPMVFLSAQSFSNPNIICLNQNYPLFMELIGEEIVRQGVSRPLLIANTGIAYEDMLHYIAVLEKRADIRIRPEFFQAVTLSSEASAWYRQTLRGAFFRADPPDSVVVLNENIMPFLIDFFQGEYASIPLISHCNFPVNRKRRYAGVTRIGLDVREVLRCALVEIDRKIRRKPQLVQALHMQKESDIPEDFCWNMTESVPAPVVRSRTGTHYNKSVVAI